MERLGIGPLETRSPDKTNCVNFERMGVCTKKRKSQSNQSEQVLPVLCPLPSLCCAQNPPPQWRRTHVRRAQYEPTATNMSFEQISCCRPFLEIQTKETRNQLKHAAGPSLSQLDPLTSTCSRAEAGFTLGASRSCSALLHKSISAALRPSLSQTNNSCAIGLNHEFSYYL